MRDPYPTLKPSLKTVAFAPGYGTIIARVLDRIANRSLVVGRGGSLERGLRVATAVPYHFSCQDRIKPRNINFVDCVMFGCIKSPVS